MTAPTASQLPLRDIHLPPAVSWWPPAPGWWALAALVCVLGIGGILALRRRRRPPTPGERALDELRALEERGSEFDPTASTRSLSTLLRRTCLSCYPRSEVAGLIGEGWLQFLDAILGGRRFSEGPGRALLDGPYRPAEPADVEALFALCADWIRALPKRPFPRLAPWRRFFRRTDRATSGKTQLNGREP